jgi:DNA-binding NarL/FixJ family response regulator
MKLCFIPPVALRKEIMMRHPQAQVRLCTTTSEVSRYLQNEPVDLLVTGLLLERDPLTFFSECRENGRIRSILLVGGSNCMNACALLRDQVDGTFDQHGASIPQLADAVDETLTGRKHLGPSLAEGLDAIRLEQKKSGIILTPTEEIVLRLAGLRIEDAQAAELLGIEPSSYGKGCERLYRKLGVPTRVCLALRAQDTGVVFVRNQCHYAIGLDALLKQRTRKRSARMHRKKTNFHS